MMNQEDCDKKVEEMINEGLAQGKYQETEEKLLKELEYLQLFLDRHFKGAPYNKHMLTSSQFK